MFFLRLIVVSEKSTQLQSAIIIETGEKIKLLCGQLFQGYSTLRAGPSKVERVPKIPRAQTLIAI